jgi:hypothetical protein
MALQNLEDPIAVAASTGIPLLVSLSALPPPPSGLSGAALGVGDEPGIVPFRVSNLIRSGNQPSRLLSDSFLEEREGLYIHYFEGDFVAETGTCRGRRMATNHAFRSPEKYSTYPRAIAQGAVRVAWS